MALVPIVSSSFTPRLCGDFEIIPPRIGKGSFGKVWKAVNRTDRCCYALKQICIAKALPNLDFNLASLFEEVRVLQAINHPNIVRYHTSWLEGPTSSDIKDGLLSFPDDMSSTDLPLPENNFLFIQMELCETTLKSVLASGLVNLGIPALFCQLSVALHILHENNVVHRDLKLDNIFLSKDVWKIGDFGLARLLTDEDNMSVLSTAGCLRYRSPEVGCSKKSDVFSLGVVFLEVLDSIVERKFGTFEIENCMEIIRKVQLPFAQECTIILEMLHHDKDARVSSSQVMEKFKALYTYSNEAGGANKNIDVEESQIGRTGNGTEGTVSEKKCNTRPTDVESVIGILISDENILNGSNYLRLCEALGLQYIEYAQYVEAVVNENMNIAKFLDAILNLWVSRYKDEATIGALCVGLKSRHFIELSNKFLKMFQSTCPIKASVTPQRSSSSVFSAVRFGLRKPLINFVGRKSELTELSSLLRNKKLVIVTGLRGVGKTEFCYEYAKQFCTKENGDCLWFHGQSDATLLNSIAKLASQLNIPIAQKNASLSTYIIPLFSNLAFFSKATLVIVDNVDNSTQTQLVFKFINELRNLRIPLVSIRILVTSFDNMTPKNLSGEMFKLDGLSCEDATKLVKQSLGGKSSDSDVTQLLREFQNFPLHLQQAVHYIKNKSYTICGGFTVGDYIQLCRRNSTTVQTWDVNIDGIRNDPVNGELAMKLLILLSYLDPTGVKDELLFILLHEVDSAEDVNLVEFGYQVIHDTITARQNQAMPVEYFDSTSKARNALDLLHRYLLVQCTDSVLTMHRLVQDAVRRKVHSREIYYGLPPNPIPPLTMNDDHLNFLRKLTAYLAKKTLVEGSLILKPELIHFYYTWEFANADNALEKELKPLVMFICHTLLNICSNYGQDQYPYPITSRPVSDTIAQNKSKIITALKDPLCFTEFIRVLELTYNATTIVMDKYPDNVNPIGIGFLTAICLFHVGKVREASELRMEVLKSINTIFPKQDENFFTNKKSSLWSFQDIFNWRRNQIGALVILQDQYPETENIEHNLGSSLLLMGRFAEAKILLRAASTWKADNLEGGDLHPSTLNTKRLLFYCITQIDQQRDLGIKKLEEVTAQYQSIFGDTNNDLLDGTKKVLEVVRKHRFQPISPGNADGSNGTGNIMGKLNCPACTVV